MVGVRRLAMFLVVLLIAGAGVVGTRLRGGVAGRAAVPACRDTWCRSPRPRRRASVAEAADGALLVLLYWPVTRTFEDGSTLGDASHTPGAHRASTARDAFVPPFGELEPGSRDSADQRR